MRIRELSKIYCDSTLAITVGGNTRWSSRTSALRRPNPPSVMNRSARTLNVLLPLLRNTPSGSTMPADAPQPEAEIENTAGRLGVSPPGSSGKSPCLMPTANVPSALGLKSDLTVQDADEDRGAAHRLWTELEAESPDVDERNGRRLGGTGPASKNQKNHSRDNCSLDCAHRFLRHVRMPPGRHSYIHAAAQKQ